MPSIEKLRRAGFLILAAGCLVVGLGCTLRWFTVGLESDTGGVLDSISLGLDVTPGQIELLIPVAAFLTAAPLRLVTPAVRLFWSMVLPLAGVAAIALPLAYAATGEVGRVALRDAARPSPTRAG